MNNNMKSIFMMTLRKLFGKQNASHGWGFDRLIGEKLGAHILFASSEENGRIIKVEAYSTPVENSMYAIYLSSDQHGVIDSITVFFFDSLDVMYHHLRKDYQSITKVVGDIIEKQSLQDLVGIFIWHL